MNLEWTIAQQADTLNRELPQSLYLDLATIIYFGNASINYEFSLRKQWIIRLGVGAGYSLYGGDKTSVGLLSMINFITSSNSSHFEVGAGGSINRMKDYKNKIEYKIYPAGIAGYRYQSYEGGFTFRTGLGFTFAFGYLLYLSFGTTI
jgi:hypothetical protein